MLLARILRNPLRLELLSGETRSANTHEQAQELEERDWWDLWNTSHRSKDNNDEVSVELFKHVAAIIRDLSQGQAKRILEVACGTGTLSRQLEFLATTDLTFHLQLLGCSSKAARLSPPEAPNGRL